MLEEPRERFLQLRVVQGGDPRFHLRGSSNGPNAEGAKGSIDHVIFAIVDVVAREKANETFTRGVIRPQKVSEAETRGTGDIHAVPLFHKAGRILDLLLYAVR